MNRKQFITMEHKVKLPKRKEGKKCTVVYWTPQPGFVAADIYELSTITDRYVMDLSTGEHCNYDYGCDKWKAEKLANVIPGMHAWYSCSDRNVRDQANLIIEKSVDVGVKDVSYVIHDLESDYDRSKRWDAEQRRIDRIRDLQRKVPPVPADFEEWYFRATGLDELNYLIFDEKNERYKCTNCGKKIPADRAKKIRNLQETVCPLCKSKVTPRRNRNQLEISVNGHAALIQKIDEHTVVARHFDCQAEYDVFGRRVVISESQRMFYSWKFDKDMLCKKYDRRLYEAQYGSKQTNSPYENSLDFDWKGNPWNRRCYDAYLYPSDFVNDLVGSELEHQRYMLRAVAQNYVCANIGVMLTDVQYDDSAAVVEFAAKLGFRKVVRQAFSDRMFYYDISHDLYSPRRETINGLKDMPKQDRNRLAAIDGGAVAYEWLTYIRENGVKITDKALALLDDAEIGTDVVDKIPAFSPDRLCHYITRQQVESYPKLEPKKVYEQWQDYLSMAENLKKNMTDEMIIWPRELKKRHDQLAAEAAEKEAFYEAQRNKKAAMEREREIVAKFPKAAAALEKIRERYTFTDGTYMIRVPERLYEISQEGYALHHCVGSSDRYFERMDREETYICFLRRCSAPDTPFYTIEVEPGGTIRQHRGMYDEEPDLDTVKPFLKKWQKHIHKQLTEEDRALAEASREGREKSLAERLLIGGKTDRVYKGLMEDLMEIKEALEA